MRAIYHRALPTDFEVNDPGLKARYEAVIQKAIDDLGAVLTAPVNTPQYAREALEEVVNELREVLDPRDPREFYDDPADEDFLKIGGTT